MAASEPKRLALHAAARRALGDEEGDTLMALTPPANTDIATRQDLEHAQALLKVDVEHAQALLKADIEHAESRMQADIGQAESRMQAYVWKVVVGTGVVLYLALAATMLAGFQFLS